MAVASGITKFTCLSAANNTSAVRVDPALSFTVTVLLDMPLPNALTIDAGATAVPS